MTDVRRRTGGRGTAPAILLLFAVAASLVLSACTSAARPEPRSLPGNVLDSTAPPRLLRAQSDIYLIVGRARRWIVSPQVFADYRFREEWVERTSFEELERMPRGPDLIAGPVFRGPDGRVWIVFHGSRRQVAGADAYRPLNLSPDDAVSVSPSQLEEFPIGGPVGNRPRPWMAAVLVALAGAAGAVIGRYGRSTATAISTSEHQSHGLGPPLRFLKSEAALVVVVGLATLLKVAYATTFPWGPDGADGQAYEQVARYLSAGGSLLEDGPHGGLTGVTAPLYSMLLALSSGVTAITPGSVVGWKLLQVLCAVALVPLVWDLTTRLHGAPAGRVAALIAGISPLWFYSAELLQYELWLALFLTAAVWSVIRARGTGLTGATPFGWIIISGVLYGLAVFMQPKVSVVLLPAAVFLTARPRLIARPRAATRWLPLLVFIVLAAVPAGLWGLRNVAVHGEFLMGTRAAGIVFWAGNHPGAPGGGTQISRPDELYARMERYPASSITRESRAYRDLALEFIRDYPSEFALLALVKLERFWWTITPERLGEFAELRVRAFSGGVLDKTSQLLFSKLLHLLALATIAAGATWGWRSRRDGTGAEWLLLMGTVVVFWLFHAAFLAEPRYRLPISPLLHVLEAAGTVVLINHFARFAKRTLHP